MNSIDFLYVLFQFVNDLKTARIVKLDDKRNLYSVLAILDLDGEADE